MTKHIIETIDSLTNQFKGSSQESKAYYYLDWLSDKVASRLRAGESNESLLNRFHVQLEQLSKGIVPEINKPQCLNLSLDNSLVQLELLSEPWSQSEVKQAIAYLSTKLESEPPKGKIEIKVIKGQEYKYLRYREDGKTRSKYLGRNL